MEGNSPVVDLHHFVSNSQHEAMSTMVDRSAPVGWVALRGEDCFLHEGTGELLAALLLQALPLHAD